MAHIAQKGIKKIIIEAKVTKADGTVVDLGNIAEYNNTKKERIKRFFRKLFGIKR